MDCVSTEIQIEAVVEDVKECRFCRCDIPSEMMSPCECRGTIANVHFECLAESLVQQNTNDCSICCAPLKDVKVIYNKSVPMSVKDFASVYGVTMIPMAKLTMNLCLIGSLIFVAMLIIELARFYYFCWRETVTERCALISTNMTLNVIAAILAVVYFLAALLIWCGSNMYHLPYYLMNPYYLEVFKQNSDGTVVTFNQFPATMSKFHVMISIPIRFVLRIGLIICSVLLPVLNYIAYVLIAALNK